MKKTLSLDGDILKMAEMLHTKKSLIVMGRGYNFATCLEGALVRINSSVGLLGGKDFYL